MRSRRGPTARAAFVALWLSSYSKPCPAGSMGRKARCVSTLRDLEQACHALRAAVHAVEEVLRQLREQGRLSVQSWSSEEGACEAEAVKENATLDRVTVLANVMGAASYSLEQPSSRSSPSPPSPPPSQNLEQRPQLQQSVPLLQPPPRQPTTRRKQPPPPPPPPPLQPQTPPHSPALAQQPQQPRLSPVWQQLELQQQQMQQQQETASLLAISGLPRMYPPAKRIKTDDLAADRGCENEASTGWFCGGDGK